MTRFTWRGKRVRVRVRVGVRGRGVVRVRGGVRIDALHLEGEEHVEEEHLVVSG